MKSTQSSTQKPDFDVFGKNRKKSALKHSIEKPVLLSFVNLSSIFCPRLSKEINPGPLILHFLKILVFEKVHSLFKLIFKENQLPKLPEYDIFQKTLFCKILFCTLASSMNLRLNTFPVAAG